jgi:hypothetical protein
MMLRNVHDALALAADIAHVARVNLSRGLDAFVQLGKILERDRPDLARAFCRRSAMRAGL